MEFFDVSQIPANLASRSFTAGLLRKQPNGDAPLFALSGIAKTRKATNFIHGYWTKTMVFPKVTLAAAISTTPAKGTEQTLTVVSSVQVVVGSVLRAKNPATTASPENMLVTSIVSPTEIKVLRGFGGSTPQVTANGTELPEIGTSFEQGSDAPRPRSIQPVEHINKTQIFRTGWGNSRTLAAIGMEVGDGATAENKRDAKGLHAVGIERATLFSTSSTNTTETLNGRPITTMDGIESIIHKYASANVHQAGATTSFDQLEAMLEPLLDVKLENNTASNRRVIYTGAAGLKVINQIGKESGEYQVTRTETSFGQRFHTFQTTRGDFEIIEHTMLNTDPNWSKMAVVADLGSFDFMYLRETMQEEIEKVGKDSEAGVITTELTIELRNPEAWGVIYGLTKGVA